MAGSAAWAAAVAAAKAAQAVRMREMCAACEVTDSMNSHIYGQAKNTDCSTPQTCQQSCKAPRQFQPDYEIEHTRVGRDLTPLGWVVAICAIVSFVIFVARHA